MQENYSALVGLVEIILIAHAFSLQTYFGQMTGFIKGQAVVECDWGITDSPGPKCM